AAYTHFNTAKGAMVGDARLLKRESDLLLDTEPGLSAKVREFLEKYLISEDAELHEATGEWGLLRLLGPRTGEVLAGALGAGSFEPLAANATRTVSLAGAE